MQKTKTMCLTKIFRLLGLSSIPKSTKKIICIFFAEKNIAEDVMLNQNSRQEEEKSEVWVRFNTNVSHLKLDLHTGIVKVYEYYCAPFLT